MKPYEKTKKKLLSRLALLPDVEPNPMAYIRWLVSIKPTVTRATWALYKEALLEHFADINASEAGRELEQIDATGCKPRGRRGDGSARTSGLKAKFVNQAAYRKVDAYLKEADAMYDYALRGFIDATLLTGLRPVEWAGTRLEQGQDCPVLKVRNAKYRRGPETDKAFIRNRAHGEWRTLRLIGLTKTELAIIEFHLDSVKPHIQDERQWDAFYGHIRRRLTKVNNRVVRQRKHRFSLYSCRHQFCANAKSDNVPVTEIACLMGHLSEATCVIRYGKKTCGWPFGKESDNPEWAPDRPFPVRAEAAEMERVRKSERVRMPKRLRSYPGDSAEH